VRSEVRGIYLKSVKSEAMQFISKIPLYACLAVDALKYSLTNQLVVVEFILNFKEIYLI
jgi:hypothetical protein